MRGVSFNGRRLFNMRPNRKVIGLLSSATLLALSLLFVRPVSAAISYRNFSTANNGGGTTSISLTMPTSTVSGDVMIAVLSIRGGTSVTSVTPPTGWQLVDTRDSTTTLKSQVYYGVRDTVGAGPYAFTFAPATAQKASAVVTAYSGVDTVQPVDVFASQANASSAVIATPSITTTQANTMLVGAHSTAVGTTYSSSTMTYHTGAIASSTGGGGATRSTTAMQDALQAIAGPSGTKSLTVAGAAINIGHLIALRPEPIISQASYRFFQNADSTTASAPLAAKDTVAAIEKDAPFRLRLNLGVASGGSDMTTTGRTYKLQYALKSGVCGTYADVTTSSVVRFYANATIFNGATYVADATNDPSRTGITPVGQYYKESNPFAVRVAALANQDALWDVALTTSGADFGQTYCLRIVSGNNSSVLNGGYTVTPEFTIPAPTVGQANYRFFANVDSATPGAPLAAQDTAITIAHSTRFRLRQRLAVDAAQLPQSGINYKLQYAEKSGVCDVGFSGEIYQDINGAFSSGNSISLPTSAVNVNDEVTYHLWSFTSDVYAEDGSSATVQAPYLSENPTSPLYVSGYSPNIPQSAIITGIEVYALWSGAGGGYVDVVLNGNTHTQSSAPYVFGGPTDLWGQTFTPTNINSGFGITVHGVVDGWSQTQSVNVDVVRLKVYYTAPQSGDVLDSDNPGTAHLASIVSSGSDPTNGARPTVYQSYREANPFTNNVGAIPEGSDGLWDFALTSSPAAAGKTYCIRTVDSTGSPLDSYSQIPEVTFASGASGPTTEQKLRGGRSVISGVKSPFEL